MTKSKLLTFAVIALFFINITTLAFLFFRENRPGNRPKHEAKRIIIEKLHFDENQIYEYEKLIKTHKETINSLDDSIRKTKNELYQLLNYNTLKTTTKDSLFLKLANYQKQIEILNFNHFLEIKKICKKEQMTEYQDLTRELSNLFSSVDKLKK